MLENLIYEYKGNIVRLETQGSSRLHFRSNWIKLFNKLRYEQ